MFAFKVVSDVKDEPTLQELAQAFSGSSLGRGVIANIGLFVVFRAVGAWWW